MQKRGLLEGRTAKLHGALRVLLLIAMGGLCLFSQSVPGPNMTRVKEITDLEQQRAAAIVHRDLNFLDTMTAIDSVRVLPTGALETKSEFLTQLKSGALTYSSIDVDQLAVKLYDNIAVVTGRSVFQGQREGKPFNGQRRFSRVWVKENGGWREVLFQLTTTREH